MVYAHKVCRVTFSGKMYSGAEEWSTGHFLGQESDDSEVPEESMAQTIADNFAQVFVAGNMKISNQFTFDTCKLASIGTDGHTITSEVVYAAPAGGPWNGAATTNHHPPQCSLVVTLQSDRPRGPASKGRMYLPGYAGTIEAGRVPSADRENMSVLLQTYFQTYMDQFWAPGSLILAAKNSGPLGIVPAQNDYVETIKLGDVIDTQRRRRNGLSEVYTTKIL